MPYAVDPPETASDAPKAEEKDAKSAPSSEETPHEAGDENAQPL